jgi:hypothetical protein
MGVPYYTIAFNSLRTGLPEGPLLLTSYPQVPRFAAEEINRIIVRPGGQIKKKIHNFEKKSLSQFRFLSVDREGDIYDNAHLN